jgi:hypothetical protein
MKAQNKYLLVATIVLTLTTLNCGGGGSSNTSTTPVNAGVYGTSCGTNMLNSQYGCLPQCGQNAVTYQGQCVQITNTNGTVNGQYGYGTGVVGGGADMCRGICPVGHVQVQGGFACLQQGSCGPCYGQYGPTCYIGDYAYQYYRY